MASLAKDSIRYYVGRINVDTKQEQVLHFNDYNYLFSANDDFSQSSGFKDAGAVNRLVSWLNNIEKEVATSKEREIKYHYFTFRKDDKVTTLSNYEIPKKEEQPVEEEPTQSE